MSRIGETCPHSIFLLHPSPIRESCNLITFEKIATFICQSQKQNLAFKLDNFRWSEISRCKEIFSNQNDMIQNKINNLVSIAIFLLYKKMLLGHKKVKIVLGIKFEDKTIVVSLTV